MRMLLSLLLLAAVLISFVMPLSTALASCELDSNGESPARATCEGPGSSSAEEAALLYLDGLKSMDLPKMLSAFAVETYVDLYDFSAQLQTLGVYSPTMTIAYPSTNSLFRAINIESRRQDVMGRIKMQAAAFCAIYISGFDAFATIPFQGENAIDSIRAFEGYLQISLDGMAFNKLVFTGFVSPSLLSDLYSDERLRQNMAQEAARFGADELQSIVAGFSIDDQSFLFCCDALRYGDKWYLESLGGHIGQLINLPVGSGGIMPTE